MKPRSKKPKCAAANKACGMACKPKAAICADQRKKLLANAKKGGLKGQAAKDYVQARVDRYKNLVSGKGSGDVNTKNTIQKPVELPTRKPEAATVSEKGGRLATVKKVTLPGEPSPKRSIFEQINDEWASDNPTESDAKAWINAHVEARFNPTPANVEQRTANYFKNNFQGEFESRTGIAAGKFSGRVVDRDSYAKAAQASEAWERKNRPEGVARRLNEEGWIKSRTLRLDGLKLSDISELEKKIATAKSEGIKKKAMRDLASLRQDEANLPAIKEQVRRDVARQVVIQSASKADRIEQLKQDFDAESAKQKSKMEAVYSDIKIGKKSAIKNATFEAASQAGVGFRESKTRIGEYEQPTLSDFQDHLKILAVEKDTKIFKLDKKTTKAEIRKQYRALAESAHPDKPGGSAEKFRRLTNAYNKVLRDFD